VAGALLRLMVIALLRDGVASGARLAGWASQPSSPAAACRKPRLRLAPPLCCGPLGAARLDRRGLPVRSCRPPAPFRPRVRCF